MIACAHTYPERIPQPNQAEAEQHVADDDNRLNSDRSREHEDRTTNCEQDTGAVWQDAGPGERGAQHDVADTGDEVGGDQLRLPSRRTYAKAGDKEVLRS